MLRWSVGSSLALSLAGASASAMDLDWSGQFQSEAHWVKNTTLGNGLLPSNASNGYTVTGGGADSAQFQTLFARLRPKVIVNDNVTIKSEWWMGDPIYGLFGGGAPYGADQRQYYSNQSRGSSFSVQRLWLDVITEVGTVQVGRTPLQWGLGVVWNAGEGVHDKYQSTGDSIRLISKFGSFSFVPAIVKYSFGNAVGGSCQYTSVGVCTPSSGGQGVSDYSLQFKYENPDEDLEGGVNFIKRIAGPAQNPTSGFQGIGGVGAGANYNTWSLYARKKIGKLSLAGEVPIASGDIGGTSYDSFAVATEANYALSDSWEFRARLGRASGQPNSGSASSSRYRGFYFNPNYRIALVMFNYALQNFSGSNSLNDGTNATPATLKSPYDNPITNATYWTLGGAYRTDKWKFHSNFAFARAVDSATSGYFFFNTWQRRYAPSAAVANQGTGLGWEMDYGTSFQYDDNFNFGLDLGWWFPGDYYAFSNAAAGPNKTDAVFAMVFSLGVNF